MSRGMLRRAPNVQPSVPLPIDTGNTLSEGLTVATYTGGSRTFFDMVTWKPFTDPYPEQSYRNYSITKWGRARSTNGGSYRNTIQFLGPNGQLKSGKTVGSGRASLLLLVRPKRNPTVAQGPKNPTISLIYYIVS